LSKVVYVELINPQKRINQSKMVRIDSGFFHNNFILPDTLTSGTYYLRAYTSLNRNFGDSNLYVKPIPVLSITDKVDPGQGKSTLVQSNLLSIATDKASYGTREKILLTLKTTDEDGNSQSANLSVSVTDAGQVVPVEEPYGIMESFPLRKQDRQLSTEFKYPMDNGISFTGRFFNDKEKPEKATLSIMQWNPRNMMFAETDEDGIFTQTGLSFYNSMKFSVKSDKAKDKPYGNIKLQDREIPLIHFGNEKIFPLNILKTQSPQRIISEYEVSKEVRMLDNVIVKGEKIAEPQNTSTYGRPDVVIKTEDIKLQYDNLLNSLVGIPGVEVNAGFPGSIIIRRASGLSIYNANNPTERNSGPLVTIDDVPIAGKAADILATINVKTVARVEITKRINVLYGSTAGGGVVAVYTKNGTGYNESEKTPNFQSISVKGYSRSRDFKSPVYEDSSRETSADFRSTLYWNPKVVTDEKGEASVFFYSSDLSGRYRIVVEGVTRSNQPVRSEYFITIKNE
jgi:TonB-dependent Receptor Plug Domain